MSQFLDPGHGDPCRHCSKGLKVCCQPFVTPPNSKPAYVYLIEVELYIAKEVISFSQCPPQLSLYRSWIWIKDGQGIAGAAGMPTLFFGCLTLALRVPIPSRQRTS